MSEYRGHKIEEHRFCWVYADNHMPVPLWKNRPCGHCGLPNTLEGHDGCLDTLPGVMNACCGHGSEEETYIQYEDTTTVHGVEAIATMNRMLSKERVE